MEKQRIHQLIEVLPARAAYPAINIAGLSTNRLVSLARVFHCVNDPRFGYELVRSFIDLGLPLALGVHDLYLLRTYYYLVDNAPDSAIEDALMIEHSPLLRSLLKACLIDPEISIPEISERLQIPIEVIKVYDALFWNVRDRLNDESYIAHLVYPKTRRVEFEADYIFKESSENLTIRAAYNYGFKTALEFAGLRIGQQSDVEQMARQVEQIILTTAVSVIKLGGANQSKLPVIKLALQLIAKRKRARNVEPTRSKDQPAHNFSFNTILPLRVLEWVISNRF